ncbi:glutathione synthase [Parapusillimonas granuli]|uniref:Glutathione synthetase n=1 Tax=Parapusillimonas granuli TaxID=380911 RepID=A0A853G4R8_9BURK|nr:glutathione synthase [Parapusillimonas granuli]MBB5214350.1 glutathione synthase [Parapusillimonas granuli]MEB2399163.1 glutathione synthase [Alcaligenaceae bacterium]NYT51883.1 glutathione synthase [Parapusillimonas granuli]
MHVLFIIDPLPSLKAYKDTSVAMMRALAARGHTISVAYQGGLYIDEGVVMAEAMGIDLVQGADLHEHAWWRPRGNVQETRLSEFSAVLMRKDPPFDMEYVYATHLLEYAEAQGARVFNSGAALRNHPEKLAITEFAEFTAPTLVTRNVVRLRAFHAKHRDVVVKPLDGMGGTGIFRLQPDEHNLSSILEMLTGFGTRTIMAQRYIPEITDGDKRLLLIAGQPVPYVLARIPLAGETRGNLAAGGRGVAREPTARDLEIAQAIGPKLVGRGLLLVGLDIIGDYVTEVNVTSPTCFVEITEQTGYDVAAHFAAALEHAVGL